MEYSEVPDPQPQFPEIKNGGCGHDLRHQLEPLHKDLIARINIIQHKLEEERRCSEDLWRLYEESRRRNEEFQYLAGETKCMEEAMKSVIHTSMSKSGSQSTSPEEQENNNELSESYATIFRENNTNSSETCATTSQKLIMIEKPSDVVDVGKILTLGIDVNNEYGPQCDNRVAAAINVNVNYSKKQSQAPNEVSKEEEDKSPQMVIGCRFHPTDQDLIVLLQKKIAGEITPAFIKQRDLYGSDEPGHIFLENPSANALYFFTLIKKKFHTGGRTQRLVGNGTWKIQKTKDIFADPQTKSEVIGKHTTLNFTSFQSKTKKENSWIMHEYALKDGGPWVICRIKRGRDNHFGLASSSLPASVASFSLKRPLIECADINLEMPNNKRSGHGSWHQYE